MKKSSMIAVTALPLLLFNSCFNFSELAVPESVSVKTDATYRASIGEKSIDFSDKINLSELLGSNTPDDYNVYDYSPVDDRSSTAGVKKFLVEAKLQEVELDFSRLFENSSIDTAIQGASFSQDIRVPTVGLNVTRAATVPAGASAAQNLMADDATENVTVTFSTAYTPTIDTSIQDCVIGEGNLIVSITEPAGWQDVTITSVSLSQTGGLSVSGTPNDASAEISLANKHLNTNELTLTATITATISKTTNLANPPAVSARTEITEFASVTVDLGDNFNPDLSTSFDLNAEMVNSISSITFAEGTGIRGSYVNNLPAVEGDDDANKITLTGIYSNFLGLGSSSSTLSQPMTAGGNTGNINLVLGETETTTQSISSSNKTVDFHGSLSLPGATSSHPTWLTAQKLVPGRTYHIGVNIDPVINWSEVSINSSVLGDTDGSNISDTIVLDDLDIGGMLNDFGDTLNITDLGSKVGFTSLPIYLYCQLPNEQILSGLSMSAKISAYRGNSSGTVQDSQIYIVGSSSAAANLTSRNVPTLYKTSSGVVTTNLDNVTATAHADLADAINDVMTHSGSALCLKYDITTTLDTTDAITIRKADLDSLSTTNTSISIYAYIALPFSLSVNQDLTVDLIEMMDMQDKEDLFDRDEATSVDDMEKFLNAIEAATIVYKPTRLPFISATPLSVTIDLDGDERTVNGETVGNNFAEETLYLSGGELSVNPQLLLETYPLKPKIALSIPSGTFGISSDLSFGMNVQAAVKTNGTINLFGGQ